MPEPVEAASAPLVEAKALTKRFGDYVAVDGVDFEVHAARSSASWGPTAPARPRPCG